jgi:hypothetical protein
MPSNPEMSPADTFGVVDFLVNNAEKITSEIGNAGAFDRTDIHDPQQQLEYKRGKIESDHQGLRGAVGSLYSAFGWQPSYQQEMDESTDAQHYAAAGDTKSAEDASKQQESARLQQLRAQLDTTAASETKTEFERQRDSINQEYAEQLQAANEVQNGRTFQSQGFKSQADANAFAQHLRDVAGTIRTAEGNKLELAREGELASGQGRLDVLKQAAAGDTTGDSKTKSQLQQEIAAATEAGKKERDALQMELQRTKGQTGMGENGLTGAAANHLADVSKKLDDAVTKLEKAISNLKSLSVLKD